MHCALWMRDTFIVLLVVLDFYAFCCWTNKLDASFFFFCVSVYLNKVLLSIYVVAAYVRPLCTASCLDY